MKLHKLFTVFLHTALALVPVLCVSQSWLPLGGGVDNFRINSFYEDQDNDLLFVGGQFEHADSVNARGIATWNGKVWSSVGGGLDTHSLGLPKGALTITKWKGHIHIAGAFRMAGGAILCSGVAELVNDSTWTDLDSGLYKSNPFAFGGVIYKLLPTDSFLYAVGRFDSVGGVAANSVARWDGTTWEAFAPPIIETGSGSDYILYDAAFYNNELYVVGNINGTSSANLREIAKWNGQQWVDVGGGITSGGTLFSCEVFKDELYVGGYLLNPADPTEHSIARWDGNQWRTVGGGLSSSSVQIQNMHVFDNKLWVSSSLCTAGDLTEEASIHYWDGNSWCQLKTPDQHAFTLGQYRDTLIISTYQYTQESVKVNYIAKMNMSPYTDTCDTEPVGFSTISESVTVFPNPFKDEIKILSNDEIIRQVAVYSIEGRLVSIHNAGSSGFHLDTGDLTHGVYFIHIYLASGKTIRHKAIHQ